MLINLSVTDKLYFCLAKKYRLKIYNITLLLLLLTSGIFCQETDTLWVSNSNKQVRINTLVKDFGLINQNEKATFKFELSNLDTSRLVIWHVTASCGCTSPSWTEKPINKDESAVVKVKYDSSELGVFNKLVLVYTNFDEKPIKLIVKGNVVSPKSETPISKRSSSFDNKIPQPQ